jgi:hypothetical protein
MYSIFYGAIDIGRCRGNKGDNCLLEHIWEDKPVMGIAEMVSAGIWGKIVSYLACKCMSEYLKNVAVKDFSSPFDWKIDIS